MKKRKELMINVVSFMSNSGAVSNFYCEIKRSRAVISKNKVSSSFIVRSSRGKSGYSGESRDISGKFEEKDR